VLVKSFLKKNKKPCGFFLMFPAAPLNPFPALVLQQGDVFALIEPHHGVAVVVNEFARRFIHVPKFHFRIPLSFLSVCIIAREKGFVKPFF
jgi:hypothetical protein